MKRTVLGVLLATLAVYLWGLVYWGLNPLPYTTWREVPDELAARTAIKTNFPGEGTYYLPDVTNRPERLAALYEEGPVAFVHVTSYDGRPQFEPWVLIKGFVLYLVTVIVVATLLHLCGASLPRYLDRLKAAALVGLAAALLINLGDAVYWYLPLAWQLQLAIYNLTAFVVIGAVLGRFVGPATVAAR